METSLYSVSKIFTERLFRIPDYQRGYAWSSKHLIDFWNDLIQLDSGSNHYAGVLTLELVPPTVYSTWTEDLWIIESKSFIPYFVVDGQQRLTTVLILIKAITELLSESDSLNYSTKSEILKKYIFDTKELNLVGSFLFGYEKDNPSYNYLKSKIFNLTQDLDYDIEKTIYTRNLTFAKSFFLEKLKNIDTNEIEIIFKKLTQNFLFNIYAISEDIDVFVTFETMNNRGKRLSGLELLKNRLIYISTKYNFLENSIRTSLRKKINEAWKVVYHYLGRNKDNPLKDDNFLIDHFKSYFDQEKNHINIRDYIEDDRLVTENDYIQLMLLEQIFNQKNSDLDYIYISNYVDNLQKSVETWYFLHNPYESDFWQDEEKINIDRLIRLKFYMSWPLLIIIYSKKIDNNLSKTILGNLEKMAFITVLREYRFGRPRHEYFINLGKKINSNSCSIEELNTELKQSLNSVKSELNLKENLIEQFSSKGFYKWHAIRYFLFEYDKFLKSHSKTSQAKIDWFTYIEELDDFTSVEHIIPQTFEKTAWESTLSKYPKRKNKDKIINSIGNLLPLSKPKNSSLLNKSFAEKISKSNTVIGYRYGCYAENEITQFQEWSVKHVVYRGVRLLKFLESRWDISLGNDKDKILILGLDFTTDIESIMLNQDGNIVEENEDLRNYLSAKSFA